eukprot:gene11940-492_t
MSRGMSRTLLAIVSLSLLQLAFAGCMISYNTDVPHQDIGRAQTDNAYQCCDECSNQPQCKAAVWRA